MGTDDFPIWFGLGSYGGLICTLLAACGIAGYALLRHRGSPLLIARAVLVCLFASVLMLAPIWWEQSRLQLYGPTLDDHEVLFWLCWTALAGWLIPFMVLLGYMLLAEPQHAMQPIAHGSLSVASPTPLDDPERFREPLGAGIAWGRLVPVQHDEMLNTNGTTATNSAGQIQTGPAIIVTRQMTVLGREIDCDIVVEDQRASRHHAEIHWDHGRAVVMDRSSMNGTLVNRQTVRGPTPLVTGDLLEIGLQRYRFEFITAPQSAMPDGPTELPQPEVETRKVPSAQITQTFIRQMDEPMPLVLTGLSVPIAGVIWPLDQPVITIGRDKARQIAIVDESVSRLHAQIVRQQAGYFLSDLNSSNGTFLNNEALIAPSLLTPGDILRFGAIELRCEQATLAYAKQVTIPLDSGSILSPTATLTSQASQASQATPTIAQTA